MNRNMNPQQMAKAQQQMAKMVPPGMLKQMGTQMSRAAAPDRTRSADRGIVRLRDRRLQAARPVCRT